MLKINIKRDRCCGAQLCVQVAPDVYRLDALGYNDSDGQLAPPGREEAARQGAMSCPEAAIQLETLSAGE